MRKFSIIVSLLAVFVLALAGCGKDDNADDADKTEIKVGTSPGPYSLLFLDAVKPILEEEGYTIKQVEFNDLLQADVALADGGIDLNVDQHTAYLENFNENKKADLTSITPIPTVPAGLFPGKKTSLDDIKEGDTIGIPNDPSNAARAYAILQKAEIIKLKDGVEPIKATAADIEENPHGVKIVEMDSAQIPRSLSDLEYGVVPGSIVFASNMDPSTKLVSEDVEDHLVLVATTTEKHKDSQWAKDVAAAYKSDEFKEYLKEHNKDDYWFVPKELQ
ncbi:MULTISPECIES: MetQ/NlpA family ABC transporter substrate-binding protein [unclassified Sporosarcina]|uniref:MetQ/NlpA family ABC transporter substrate-binding protein n=1 Tax=unclassified Sporosarcina TaxID=2647733 RepID=UPI00203F0453|nr:MULTISPECIES: MetQ/NlpA family ABC transporter substrate-binding protein [unclassified Sporosarcina]GKV64052.1 lipoprotein [Sporosarcina sp. NCCP-2331]GLB56373.1 lipoprotein [Sporosarcina sp. NCCP-2378]